MKNTSYSKPSVLFIHNKYLHQGGEDSVVRNEMEILKKEGYEIFYKEYNNLSFQQARWRAPLLFTRLFFNLSSFFYTYFFVKRHHINVVHVHNFFYTASPSVFWAARAARARTVMTMHNYRLFCLNALFFRDGKHCMACAEDRHFKKGITYQCFKSSTLFSWALAGSNMLHRNIGTWKNKVDQFIVINPLMQQLLSGMDIDRSRIIIKPNFLPNQHFNDYASRGDYYLYAGRLQEEKGIRHVIEAFQLLDKKLIIAGEGELEAFVRLHTGTHISYIGQQSRESMTGLFLNCKGFIFSSLLLEGMPMTIIEAQASGAIPIVAQSIITETMITDGQDGFLYDPGNSTALANTIRALESKTTDELNTLSQHARRQFLRHYEASHHIRIMKEVYGFTG